MPRPGEPGATGSRRARRGGRPADERGPVRVAGLGPSSAPAYRLHELIVVLSGCLRLVEEQSVFTLRAGDALFLRPDRTHGPVEDYPRDLSCYWLHFGVEPARLRTRRKDERLMLMLPSANREIKEQLRMFRDSGGFDRFFPVDDDAAGHRALLERVPNLDTFEGGGFWGRQVKTSLGNTLRLLRPMIVLDEGHKAYSRNAKATLEGFNPSLIVELSATPTTEANVLIEIFGRDLNAEEMIKLDLHIRNRSSTSWKDTLLAAVEHRAKLEEHARRNEAATGMPIHPICLIQVERTGRDQRQPGVVHAEDAREYLMEHPDIGAEHIAVKTSARDDLKEVDDAGGLLARDCQIRFILTKQALQEGWDCALPMTATAPWSRRNLSYDGSARASGGRRASWCFRRS